MYYLWLGVGFHGSFKLRQIRTFYKPNKIEYKIYKDVNGNISIVQQLYVTNELNTKGYYTMSNIVTSKIDEKSTISLSQSFYFE